MIFCHYYFLQQTFYLLEDPSGWLHETAFVMQELEMKCYGIHVLCSSTYYSDPKLKEVSVLRLCENRIRNNETSTSTCDLYNNKYLILQQQILINKLYPIFLLSAGSVLVLSFLWRGATVMLFLGEFRPPCTFDLIFIEFWFGVGGAGRFFIVLKGSSGMTRSSRLSQFAKKESRNSWTSAI